MGRNKYGTGKANGTASKEKENFPKGIRVQIRVSLGSLKRFEQTGEISLQSFTKLAIALGAEGELEALFKEVPFDSIEEILHGQTK